MSAARRSSGQYDKEREKGEGNCRTIGKEDASHCPKATSSSYRASSRSGIQYRVRLA